MVKQLVNSISSFSILARFQMQSHETMYKTVRWGVVLTALLCGLLLGGCDRRPQSAAPPVPEVAIVTLQPQELVLTTELPGRTYPHLVAEIRPQVNGIIQKRLFTEGSDVKAGQVLYQIDPAPFKAALDNAMANLAKAQANQRVTRLKFERYKGLLAEKAVSQQDYDDREAALQQAEADVEVCKATVETARINLEYTRVTAPISGRIGKSNVTDGALVTAHQPIALATIQQLDPIYVDVPQSTAELLRLRSRLEDNHMSQDGENHKEVKLILENGKEYPFKGTLLFRDVTVDPTTGSVVLRILFPNPKGVLLPGMFVRAAVIEGTNEQAILLLQQAVSRDPKGNAIALVADSNGKIEQRSLTLDRAIGDKWLVSSGLSSGDRVVVEGIQKIRPGGTVKTVPFDIPRKAEVKPGNTADPAADPK
jgi:membrane fusion protein (multidrug efflux system)